MDSDDRKRKRAGYAEAAKHLGISEPALRARVSRGTIPFRVRDRGKATPPVVLFNLDELDAWLDGERPGEDFPAAVKNAERTVRPSKEQA